MKHQEDTSELCYCGERLDQRFKLHWLPKIITYIIEFVATQVQGLERLQLRKWRELRESVVAQVELHEIFELRKDRD